MSPEAIHDATAGRLLLVHAHPDDESIGTGGTMATYVDAGAQVSLVTCTMGEEGEVLVDELVHLRADHDDELGPHRMGELDAAMAALGVTDYQRLGGDFRFRDSGMAYDDRGLATARDTLHVKSFWTVDLLEPTDELVAVIRAKRPHVLITYDEFGGYGHPDHVQAHRVSTYAYALSGVPTYRPDLGAAWQVPRVLWTAMSESFLREGIRALRAAGDTESWGGFDPDGDAGSLPPMVVADEAISCAVDATDVVDRKLAALRAYPTQIKPDSQFFSISNTLGDQAWSHEYFRFAGGQPFPATDGWASDVFAGLDLR